MAANTLELSDYLWHTRLTNWQNWGHGEYTTALEPGTNPPIGRTKAKEQGDLIMLETGQSRNYELEFSIISGSEQVNDFLETSG